MNCRTQSLLNAPLGTATHRKFLARLLAPNFRFMACIIFPWVTMLSPVFSAEIMNLDFAGASETVVDKNTVIVEGASGGSVTFHLANADVAITGGDPAETGLTVTSKKVATLWFEFSGPQLAEGEGLQLNVQFHFARKSTPPTVFRIGMYQKNSEAPQAGDQGFFLILSPQNQTAQIAQTGAKGGRFLMSGPGTITTPDPLPGMLLDDQPHSLKLTIFPKKAEGTAPLWQVNYSFDDNAVSGSHVFEATEDFSADSFNMAALVFSEDQVLTIKNLSVKTLKESP